MTATRTTAKLALLLFLAAPSAWAQYAPPHGPPPGAMARERPHLYFGIEGEVLLILKQVTDQVGYMGQGGGGNLTVGYRFGRNFALELNLGGTYHDEQLGTPQGFTVRALDNLFLVSTSADVKIHFPTRGRLEPYLQAGVGYGYLGATYFSGYCDSFSCDTTFAQGPLFQVGGGFDYWFSPWISFGVRGLYRAVYFNEANYGDGTVRGQTGNFINAFKIGINGTFHFM